MNGRRTNYEKGVRRVVAMIDNAGPKALRDENSRKRHVCSAFEAHRRSKTNVLIAAMLARSSMLTVNEISGFQRHVCQRL